MCSKADLKLDECFYSKTYLNPWYIVSPVKTKDIEQQRHEVVLEKTNTAMKRTLTLNKIGDFSLFELC